MHDRLTEILGQEVVGEVTQIGDSFFDVSLGRVCLDKLERARVDQLLDSLREEYGGELKIKDRLFPSDPSQVIRGLVEVELRDPATNNPYLLQITSMPICSFYERRFMIEPEVMGDLMGTFGQGLHGLVGDSSERPLRILSNYEGLLEKYLSRLDRVVKAVISGVEVDPDAWVEELIEPIRSAWKVIPWPLRSRLDPVFAWTRDRVTRHDQDLRRTVLFAANVVDGELAYEYCHQHSELEEYDQVLGWMTEIHQAMNKTYPPPRFATAMARASSTALFRSCFPGYGKIVGSVLKKKPTKEGAAE